MQLSPNLKTITFFGNEPLHIENDGQEITYTDYWSSILAKNSYYFLSCNEMCFRLLIPPSRYTDIKDIITGAEVLLTYGVLMSQKSIEILFEDHTQTPFRIYIVCWFNGNWSFPLFELTYSIKGEPHEKKTQEL